ncbi:hypothetical protein HN953_00820 [Candidatus Woesearchaeota archaeon]|jgi:hypothetical protein|nr:hypothetical protein [Candidatus Woesearchaeota archaeon]
MDIFDTETLRKSFAKIREDEMQPFEMAIARIARDLGGIGHLDEKTIIAIYRICDKAEELLRDQFKGK